MEDSVWKPVGFFSRKLSEIEQRYATYDHELLAVFAAIKFYRRILESRPFTVETDHKPLIFAEFQRSDKASPRQQRQLDYILQFNMKLVHVKSEENVVANVLSRTCAIAKPTLLDGATISEAQSTDNEHPHEYPSDVLPSMLYTGSRIQAEKQQAAWWYPNSSGLV